MRNRWTLPTPFAWPSPVFRVSSSVPEANSSPPSRRSLATPDHGRCKRPVEGWPFRAADRESGPFADRVAEGVRGARAPGEDSDHAGPPVPGLRTGTTLSPRRPQTSSRPGPDRMMAGNPDQTAVSAIAALDRAGIADDWWSVSSHVGSAQLRPGDPRSWTASPELRRSPRPASSPCGPACPCRTLRTQRRLRD